MSPLSTRNPSPASGGVAETGGRHRRPESLADEPRSAPVYRVSTLLESDTWIPGPRSARHRPAPRRHAPSHRAAAPTRPPVTGSHRAPGTVPIESWLLMGKKRQQLLLASLVAVGLLLVAVPGSPTRDGLDAVNAAARATGKHTQHQDKGAGGARKGDTPGAKAAPSASAPVTDVPVLGPTGAADRKVADAGPGNSLRTTGSATVALTFDDGPDPTRTPQILALLAKYQIKATFCLVGQQVVKHPEIVREIVAGGHTLCNHTWNHSLTIGKDKPEQIQADLARTNAAIRAAVPDAKIPFFRAPGGNFTDRLVDVAGADGMTSLYWEVDPKDWQHKTGETDAAHTDRVIAEVRKHVRPGSIVLSHDFNQPDTIAAYEKLLPWLKATFTLGIPGAAPAPAATTPPTTAPEPTPTDTPAAPDPSASASPAPADTEATQELG
ncbi:polysaccharide deacetylase family protein [Actinoplanes sp. KI2]|uniref:polysaccharide deacetylase family protein n=1 Tax=Actinoplanes sp. KI2 TaxID=2983315 RepID=UPI0021D5E54C|nr:polysaccharide deacetylase family protein [Actinoplanes sp. KI2]MCU7724523.1 polysaccharide deacetylase family protein [Actinoplanes sp. KI2]